jgi:hypothetical protein
MSRCLLLLLVPLLLNACAQTRRSPYVGDGAPPPPTVRMPAELSARERQYVGEVEASLRAAGMVPVYRGRGDRELEFRILEGPVNTDTRLRLEEDGREIARGEGRGSGPPLIRREQVAEESFRAALQTFEAALRPWQGVARAVPEPWE